MEDKNRTMTESEIQEKRLRDAARARKRRKAFKSFLIWVIIIGAIIVSFSYSMARKKRVEAERAAMMNQVTVIEAVVEESVYTQTIDLSGHVEPNDILQAKFRSTGAITGVYVKEGEYVKEGQLLASIDNTSQLISLQNIQNQIDEARLNGAVKQLQLLELQKKNAENNLDYTNLYANFDGVVASVGVEVNGYSEAGAAAVTIIDRSKLKATVEIDEIDMKYVYEGQPASLSFDSLPGVEVDAYVSYIPMLGRYTNQGIGVVDVELTIDNPPENLIPGFTFEGSIEVQGDVSMLILPSAAVTTERGGLTTVNLKLGDGSTEKRTVKVKYLGEGLCQILSGLEAGDVVTYEQVGGLLAMMESAFGL
ncbi:MAG: efflux RND transporter periplasmic adaptor subunit [Spirochaetales bacterium]|nr:efflux RND transporter periplasmic adaptor subunit [Spirochaetales bacterium]